MRSFKVIDNVHVPLIKGAGGGKGGAPTPSTAPDNLFSSDFGFALYGLGEGPVYRINPNGPQDLEIAEGAIDALLDGMDSAKESFDPELFYALYAYGTLNQAVLPNFGDRTAIPQSMASPIQLSYGRPRKNIPPSKVELRDTSVGPHTEIEFRFVVNSLFNNDGEGNIENNSFTLKIDIYDRAGITLINTLTFSLRGKTTVQFPFTKKLVIPAEHISEDGYKFTIQKTSFNEGSPNDSINVSFVGWIEFTEQRLSYPRTAMAGYAIKANDQYKGAVPATATMVKGLIIKVPSNYNQPVLQATESWDGTVEIDWRQLEIPSSATTIQYETGTQTVSVGTNGYTLQSAPTTTVYDTNPQIYKGEWDGSFVYSWTQNPVWIVYDLLTNTNYGLGIAEGNIDKYKFYRVAKYCDACDELGYFQGVEAIADGSYRYQPKGLYRKPRRRLQGVPNGTSVKERRFISDIIITDQEQVFDIINKITSTFRGILLYAGGLLTLNVDMPDEYYVAQFNETNILPGISITGVEESDLISGVEVSYLDVTNHYRRELVRVDDPILLSELNGIENVTTVDLIGVTRRSQAIRYANYLLAANKYLRRQVAFETDTYAQHVIPGNVIVLQQKIIGTNWAYGGRLSQDTINGSGSVYLEHFGYPAISNDVFTASSNIALRVTHLTNDTSNLYLISTSAEDRVLSTGANTSFGVEKITVQILKEYNFVERAWVNPSLVWGEFCPKRGDLWSLGPIDRSNGDGDAFYRTNDKLFKVTGVDRTPEAKIKIEAVEYVPNVYTDSDTVINYEPSVYADTTSPLSAPPSPSFDLMAAPTVNIDGSVRLDLVISETMSLAGYNSPVNINYFYSRPDSYSQIFDLVDYGQD